MGVHHPDLAEAPIGTAWPPSMEGLSSTPRPSSRAPKRVPHWQASVSAVSL
jgi:hypothetical protein